MPKISSPKIFLTLLATTALICVGLTVNEAAAAPEGTITNGQAESSAVGTIDYNIYLPPGYDDSGQTQYRTLYLLHGRGDTMAAWPRVSNNLDSLINEGTIEPLIVIMPNAPWNGGGSWYTDSLYTGNADTGVGQSVETAIATDLVEHIDTTYPTSAQRDARAIGGYSMGGAGALQIALHYQQTFSAGIILSPAVYTPVPPADSSTRDYGAYGVGDELFNQERYEELSYRTSFANFDANLPLHLFIAVGDDEWANPDPAEQENDLDFESARLYNQARRVGGISAELRILGGGHDWEVWEPAFTEAIVDVSSRLRVGETDPWEAQLFGSTGDDRAGGYVETSEQNVLALNLADSALGYDTRGGMDILLLSHDSDGNELWRTPIVTEANERAYGLVAGKDGTILGAGYSRGDLNTGLAVAKDQGIAFAVSSDGQILWQTQIGDPTAATRFYATCSDGEGGLYAAGYTSGSIDGQPNAGDKDALLVRISATGQMLWAQQIGGSGEDKALAVALGADGTVTVGGNHGAGLPGLESVGGYDGWIAQYDSSGSQQWIRNVATDKNDQVNGLAVAFDGTVAAVGHTKGALGPTNLGDNDIFVTAYSSTGDHQWTQQVGTTTDDRGLTIAAKSGEQTDAVENKGFMVVGTTYGNLAGTVGSVDLVSFPISLSGEIGKYTQFGSLDRDGVDEWDDPNLFLTSTENGYALTGLTYGSSANFTNQGSGDIFLQSLTDEAGGEVDPEPTLQPTEATEEPTKSGGSTNSTKPSTDEGTTAESNSENRENSDPRKLANTGISGAFNILTFTGIVLCAGVALSLTKKYRQI